MNIACGTTAIAVSNDNLHEEIYRSSEKQTSACVWHPQSSRTRSKRADMTGPGMVGLQSQLG